MAKIEYKIVGDSNFLGAAEYSFHISNFIKEFESKFLLAENILIHFEESINPNPNKSVFNEFSISDDGKNIKLVYKTSRFLQPKGGISQPSATEFFSGLKYYLEHTVIAGDNKRFNELNNKVEE